MACTCVTARRGVFHGRAWAQTCDGTMEAALQNEGFLFTCMGLEKRKKNSVVVGGEDLVLDREVSWLSFETGYLQQCRWERKVMGFTGYTYAGTKPSGIAIDVVFKCRVGAGIWDDGMVWCWC